jgi:hypothetical protein
LVNLRFIKEGQAELFNEYKNNDKAANSCKFNYDNTAMTDFKKILSQDFEEFKKHLHETREDGR